MNEATKEPEYNLTAKEVAAKFKCTGRHIIQLANDGKIPGLRIGIHWRFDLAEVIAALKQIPAHSRKRTADVEAA